MKNTIMKSHLLILLVASFASAEQVQVDFSGVLTQVDQGTILGDEVMPGTTFHGSYFYQDAAIDTIPEDDEWGVYEFSQPINQYIIRIDEFTFSATNYKIAIRNRDDERDSYAAYSRAVIVSDGINSVNWSLVQLLFQGVLGEPFESDSLDQVVSLDDWDSTHLTMYPYHHGPLVEGEITSFEYVPEPGTISLLLVGGCVTLRRRKTLIGEFV